MNWLFALLPFAAAAPTALVALVMNEAPPASQVQIRSITYGGTGCPGGTVSSQISADRSVMTLIFDSYFASIGPGIAVTEQRKNCQLNVDILYPSGFQYSILSADYRGYFSIPKGVTITLKSTYFFSGQTAQSSTACSLIGPINGDYLKHVEIDSTSVVWSPCGASSILNINSQVRLTSSNSSAISLPTPDSTDLKSTQVMYMQWKKCTTK